MGLVHGIRRVLPPLGLLAAGAGVLFGINDHWQWLSSHVPWLPQWKIDTVLAFTAIIFAFIQFVDARIQEKILTKQEGELTNQVKLLTGQGANLAAQQATLQSQQQSLIEQKDNLEKIAKSLQRNTDSLGAAATSIENVADSLYTKFVGRFPDNIKQITELIAKAQFEQSIKIIIDYPRYGEYSSPTLCEAYISAIEQARAKITEPTGVQIICYSQDLAAKTLHEQFPDDEVAFGQRDDSVWKRYFGHYRGTREPKSFEGLREILLEHDNATLNHLGSLGVNWKFHKEPAAFFLWILDDREVIFTFNNMGVNDTGLSFLTRDKSLVDVFSYLFARRWEKAEPS